MKKSHKNKFKTPEGYFDNFNERLIDKIIKEESIIPKHDGFEVPDDYFETFNKKIVTKFEPKIIQLKPYRNYYYIAASIIAILVFTFLFNQNKESKVGFDDLAVTELDAYFDSNVLGLSDYEIADYIPVENIYLTDITYKNIEENTILDYLDENVDELDELNIMYDEFE